MVDGIGKSGLGRSAIEAALQSARKRQADALARMAERVAAGGADASQRAEGGAFSQLIEQSIGSVDEAVKLAEQLPREVLQGKLDFHEVAARLKQSELAFDFAMQVRNKFIDAYREVMRMSV